jgi:hypothetical protein
MFSARAILITVAATFGLFLAFATSATAADAMHNVSRGLRAPTLSSHSVIGVVPVLAGIKRAVHSAIATGKIVVGGKPLSAGKVTFYFDNGQFVGSKIKDGEYAVDRVPVGTHRVTVEGKGVPLKYTSDDKSPLSVKVTQGAVTLDFDLY